jgi:flagellar biosynthesis protein FlhF
MELKRILANDLRAATEKAIKIYGPNTLVVSSERLSGGVEVIVATDFSQNADLANPPVDSEVRQNQRAPLDKSFADELAKDSFDEILYDSIGKTRNGNSKGEKSIQVPGVSQYAKKHEFSNLNKSEACNDGIKVGKEPTLGHKTFYDSKTFYTENNLESVNEWEMEESSGDTPKNDMPLVEKKPFSPEEFRARELVDRVLQEMAEMKKEFKLAKKMIHNEQNSFTEEITDFIEIVKSENLPLSLQTLLLDEISKFESMKEAFENIFSQLIESTQHVQILDASELKGTNIFVGPSGSGKTSMIMKTIHNILQEKLSPDDIAILSYKQNTVGSWTQLQLFGSSLGIDVFKVKSQETLRTLNAELSDKKLVFIDMSSAKLKNDLDDLMTIVPASLVHAVIPTDASVALAKRWCEDLEIKWDSMFLSKYDEAISPWGLLQVSLNSKIKISSLVSSGSSVEDHDIFKIENLVEKCTGKIRERVISSANYIGPVEPDRESNNRRTKGY